MRRSAFTILAVVATVAANSSPARGTHGGGGVVTPTQVGPLALRDARPADVVRFAGRPALRTRYYRGYGCGKSRCRANFLFTPYGSRHGRLAAAWFSSRRYATAHGTRPGSSTARALRVETEARRGRLCGMPALLLAEPTAPAYPVLYIVFGVGRERGRVLRLVLIDLDVPYHCIPHGHVLFEVD